MLTLDMVREAQEALRGIARRTPLDRAPKFGENVYIKAENLQLTGAFKLRGAYNKIRSLTPEEAARGVIACSAGNHAQGIALSASRLGIKAVICMPAVTLREHQKNAIAHVLYGPPGPPSARWRPPAATARRWCWCPASMTTPRRRRSG